MTQVISDKSIKALDEYAANIIAEGVKDLLKEQDKVILAVPGGRSVSGIFYRLKEKKIPWNKVHIFMIDERLVPIEDKESNFKLAKRNLISALVKKKLLPEQNIHPFILKKDKSDFGILDYEKELKKQGNRYDIILLSSGEDGHIGALYPNHHSIRDESKYYLVMHNSPKPPKDRMTSSKELLLKSKVAILLFLGEIKREAYNKFLDRSIKINSCPAKIVESIDDSYVLTDLVD